MNADRGDNAKLTLLPFLIAAMGKALPDWPMLNATFDDDNMALTRHGAMHLGMATQTPGGLMVPVIRDAQSKSVWQLAKEVARAGITVNSLLPGFIETEALAAMDEEARKAAQRGIPLRRFGRPEEVAAAVYFLASNEASYITGSALKIDGGIF